MAFVNGLCLAYCCPPHKGHLRPPCKGTVLILRFVQFLNGVRPLNKQPVHQWASSQQVYFSYCTNCHLHALFVNGHRLHVASNGNVHKLDAVAPHFLSQNGELSLASSTGNAGTVRTPPLHVTFSLMGRLNAAHSLTC